MTSMYIKIHRYDHDLSIKAKIEATDSYIQNSYQHNVDLN